VGVAIKNNNIDNCNKIEDKKEKDKCYTDVARVLNRDFEINSE